MTVTTIHVTPEVWARLRQLAHVRSIEAGERANASAVVSELVNREFERQAADAS
jgi:hypothetical protein